MSAQRTAGTFLDEAGHAGIRNTRETSLGGGDVPTKSVETVLVHSLPAENQNVPF